MTQTPALKQITLIGVGLIGGSFVLDLKRQGLVEKVVGIDLDADNLARALERKVIDEAFEEINAQSVGGADWVLIATPVATLPHICRQLAPLLSVHTIVSDVGSTKQSALTAFAEHLGAHLPRCVAAHPIAGSDRHGALAAQFGLYQDKKLIICPHAQQDAGALETVETLWQAVGAHTYRMSAATHDAIFAAVSHMPHMLAYAYVHQIAEHPDGQTYLDFAASGFRDFTRIASSHPAIWTDICMANKDSLLDLLAGQQQALAYLQNLLQSNDADALYRYFEEAQHTRDDWQARQ
ncbi:prephenate dehydrogenase/arogenate dehydrogenase family protein [Uruburuella suis]|uniref:prephenate dehydrogenase n=1 Tax=Uruburuella suis TaxID=252130 RepID=A0AAE9GXF3_9NEIS|nr:prephenate dehydrogenase/arogenate dehydrogenase family protein [Uruburuella suis]TCP07412.1 prephenate dehydrogenase/prephenate dehydrogenase [Uruburuella suis]UOO79947.1 prephenate dehydrogenase/arogenate dehydrogenase family protein [Uruburuella suis]